MHKKAIYAGSFDPITYGHLDILERAANLFQEVYVTVAVNHRKQTVFSGEERVALIESVLQDCEWAEKIRVNQFTGLLVDHARAIGADTLVRGVRQISDFEYEFRMALTNRRLAPDIDTVFLMPDEHFTFISASLVKEVALWNGDLSSFVPVKVARALREKIGLRE